MTYVVIYDGSCQLCSTLVQLLERLDQGRIFRYEPMQNATALQQWHIEPASCELGMILIRTDPHRPDGDQRWQGSEAAEEIARLLPGGSAFLVFYRSLPGLKAVGDQCYLQIRDHRYDWFGRRDTVYQSAYPTLTPETGS